MGVLVTGVLPMILAAAAYETGYKKSYLQGDKGFFFLVFPVPTGISILLFLWMLIRAGGWPQG